MTAYYVYRIYDKSDQLIYVGSTANLAQRLASHEANRWWAPQAVRAKATVHPSKESALAIERKAIRAEKPRWNLTGNWKANGDWVPQNYVDYITAYLNNRARPTDFGRAHIENVRRLYRARFGCDLPVTYTVARAAA